MSARSQSPPRVSFHDLPPTVWDRLEQVLERFENAWRAGERPALDDFLEGDGPERRALLIELVREDLHFRHTRGEAVHLESYLKHYPELGNDSVAARDLILAECRPLSAPPEPDDWRTVEVEHVGALSGPLSPQAQPDVWQTVEVEHVGALSSPLSAPAEPDIWRTVEVEHVGALSGRLSAPAEPDDWRTIEVEHVGASVRPTEPPSPARRLVDHRGRARRRIVRPAERPGRARRLADRRGRARRRPVRPSARPGRARLLANC